MKSLRVAPTGEHAAILAYNLILQTFGLRTLVHKLLIHNFRLQTLLYKFSTNQTDHLVAYWWPTGSGGQAYGVREKLNEKAW